MEDKNQFNEERKYVWIRGIMLLGVLGVFEYMSYRSTPFIRDYDYKLDLLMRLLTMIIAALTLLVALFGHHMPGALKMLMKICTDCVTLFMFLLTFVILLFNLQSVRRRLKNLPQSLAFTYTVQGTPLFFSVLDDKQGILYCIYCVFN